MTKHWIVLGVLALALTACGPTKSLYNWGDAGKDKLPYYPDAAYRLYKLNTPESVCELLCAYELMVSNPAGSRQVPPPGMCAEYAYFLSLPITVDAWSSAATDKQKSILTRDDFDVYAKELFEREITLYPESTHFIQPLIEKLLNR